jgi:hypothetical protein
LASRSGLFLLLEWIGGATYPLDVAAIRASGPWRAAHPQATGCHHPLHHLGSAIALLTMTAAAALWLWWRRSGRGPPHWSERCSAGGSGSRRSSCWSIAPRPSLEAHPVVVHSQSFPERPCREQHDHLSRARPVRRAGAMARPAVAAAVTAALAMGATRPLLGVHWPSDVLAGWIYGAAVVLLAWWWLRRRDARSGA